MKNIDEQIKELQAEKERLEKLSKEPWPKEITVYVHRDKENNYEMGQELGLSEDALQAFRFCCYEVAIKVLVDKDGLTKILGIKE